MREYTVRRPALWVMTAAATVTAVAVVVLYVQARATEDDLRQARASTSAAVDAARDGDLRTAIGHLRAARASLTRVEERHDGLLWSLAHRAPLVASSARTLDAVADTATAGVDAAAAVSEVLADTLESTPPGDRLPSEAVERLGEVLAGPALARLDEARARLAAPVARPVPGVLLDARAEVLDASDKALVAVPRLRDAVTVLRELLGADGERRYLVAMQNSAELRGTGGLVGFHAVLTAERGRLSLSRPQSDEELEVPAGAAPPLADAHRDWIGHARPTASLKTVNLDPDFTRTGPLLASFHEAATRRPVDGVIAVDPAALAAFMHPDDELEVPADLADPDRGLPARVAATDLPRTMLVDAYQVLGGSTDRRKAFHAALADAAFEQIVDLAWDEDLVDRLAFAVDGRHLQVYSRHAPVQEALDRLGLSGALEASGPGVDLLAVTVNNTGGGKPDVHVRHDLRARVVVSPAGSRPADGGPVVMTGHRDVAVRFSVHNPLSADGEWVDYITRTSLPGEGAVPALHATNRSWLSVWAPAGTRVRGGRGADGPLTGAVSTVGDLVVVDHLLSTPPRDTSDVELALEGDVQLRSTPDGLVYRLTLWRQAKGIADRVHVEVGGAAGWEVVSGAVDGRSDADRLGFAEQPVPLRLVVEDGVATIVGTAVGDVDVEVVLRARSE